MKFMKLGTRPDSFITEEDTRSVSSDVPSDLVIQIKSTKYLLHKFPLLPKCGLLQRLCAISGDSSDVPLALHDIPGGEEAFELCAKFCYGITINLSANNFVPAFCGAKFLRMTESVEKGNFVQKLEAFFNSCILEGWKDSVVTLQATTKLPEWSESLGIIRRCIDSIVEKILTPSSKVTWSYTYTRPGYAEKRHHSVPKDWWTEDIANLDIDLFRCIIAALRSINVIPPSLIGEALHVYAHRWLPDTSKGRPPESSVSQTEDAEKQKRVLETILSMIPLEHGSVSVGFLLRLLSIANFLGASHSTKAELISRSSWELEEAKINELLIPSCSSSDPHFYDIDLVQSVLESFLVQLRRQTYPVDSVSQRSVRRVAKLIDSYLQVISKDRNMPSSKIVSLAESLPDIARPDHDELYKAINTYLKEHPDLSKSEKKRLCRVLDCQKLSKEVCGHAVKNERLPVRTVVQLLYYDQERRAKTTSHNLIPHGDTIHEKVHTESLVTRREERSSKPMGDPARRGYQGTWGQPSGEADQNVVKGNNMPVVDRIIRKPEEGLPSPKSERKAARKEIKGSEITEEGTSGSKLEKKSVVVRKSKSESNQNKGG